MSIDWLGLIVAAVRGRRLEDVFRERIYAPCGISSTSFDVPEGMRSRLATPHRRGRDGIIAPMATNPPETAELDMGGQGLFSTVPDLLALLRVWLGDGSAPGGRVLRPETIAWATRGEPGVTVTPLQAAIPALTREVEFLPGIPTSWAYSFLVNEADVPGRPSRRLRVVGRARQRPLLDRPAFRRRRGLGDAAAAVLRPGRRRGRSRVRARRLSQSAADG